MLTAFHAFSQIEVLSSHDRGTFGRGQVCLNPFSFVVALSIVELQTVGSRVLIVHCFLQAPRSSRPVPDYFGLLPKGQPVTNEATRTPHNQAMLPRHERFSRRP